mgnify:CR=1 FL=1|jgi:hypothetical protein
MRLENHDFLVHSHKILLLNEFIEKKQIEFIKFDILDKSMINTSLLMVLNL